MTRRMGEVTLTMVNGGDFRLDGGAMHGVVPKVIWSKLASCDERNRCTYSTHCLLVETAGQRVLVETGNGDKFPAKQKDIYGIDHDRSVSAALVELGVEPESIDVVIMSHLHFDHSGGSTRRTAAGGLEPVFPRARHVVQARELHAARTAHERNRASYLDENIEPLVSAGLLETVTGTVEVAPGIQVMPTPGHTPGHQSILIDGGNGERALFLGDVMPTSVHLRLPFIMGYDLDVEATLEAKRRILTETVGSRTMLLWGHDRQHGGWVSLGPNGEPQVAEYVTL